MDKDIQLDKDILISSPSEKEGCILRDMEKTCIMLINLLSHLPPYHLIFRNWAHETFLIIPAIPDSVEG